MVFLKTCTRTARFESRQKRASFDNVVKAKFLQLINGASQHDISWFLDCAQVSLRTAEYVHNTCSMTQAYHIPWPVIWLVSRHSRRHIFLTRASPNSNLILDQLKNFQAKMRWRYKYRHDDSDIPKIIIKKKTCEPPSDPIDPVLRRWFMRVSSAVAKAAADGIASTKYNRSYCNTMPLFRAAVRIYKSSPYAAIPNDKDSSYSFVKIADIPDIALKFVNPGRCVEVTKAAASIQWSMAWELSRRIASLEEDPEMAAMLNRSLNQPAATVVAELQIKIKSQKPAGEVSFRCIHGSAGYPYAGIAAWAIIAIRAILQRELAHHLVSSGADFADRVEAGLQAGMGIGEN